MEQLTSSLRLQKAKYDAFFYFVSFILLENVDVLTVTACTT